MPKATFAGHPLHPMLIVAPAALLPFSLVMDAMHRITGKESYADAAYYGLVGALLGGVAAGTAGAMDYLAIQPQTDLKRTANIHAFLNGSALALTTANLVGRRSRAGHRGSLLLSALASIGVMVSGWFGGHMVYEHGMRVKGVSPIEETPALKLPGDARIEHAMLEAERMAPAAGPTLH